MIRIKLGTIGRKPLHFLNFILQKYATGSIQMVLYRFDSNLHVSGKCRLYRGQLL